MQFKITNQQLIEIAAVDCGLDPFAEYCTRGVYKAAGFTVKRGEKPVLEVDLWCPRIAKGDSLSSESISPGGDSLSSSVKIPGMFFQFKKCKLFCRSQVIESDNLQIEKESKRLSKNYAKSLRREVMSHGGIMPGDYESLPGWCKRTNGLPIDVMAGEIAAAGYQVEDANGLFDMLLAI